MKASTVLGVTSAVAVLTVVLLVTVTPTVIVDHALRAFVRVIRR
jgi:hypothetical protein